MGRDKKNERRPEHFTKMVRSVMETAAWRALSPVAQNLYVWLKFEWKGPKYNNNGRIALSIRVAAKSMGVHKDTVARAFHDLQAKGFIVQTRGACLGIEGYGRCPEYELTELEMPGKTVPSRLFRKWSVGHDLPIAKAARPK